MDPHDWVLMIKDPWYMSQTARAEQDKSARRGTVSVGGGF